MYCRCSCQYSALTLQICRRMLAFLRTPAVLPRSQTTPRNSH